MIRGRRHRLWKIHGIERKLHRYGTFPMSPLPIPDAVLREQRKRFEPLPNGGIPA